MPVVEGAQHRVDGQVVGDVVAVVEAWAGEEGGEPHHVDAQRREVWQPLGDPGEIADTVAVGVLEAPHVHLVAHGAAPPIGARQPRGDGRGASGAGCVARVCKRLHCEDNTLLRVLWHGDTAGVEQQVANRGPVLAARMHRHWATVEHGLASLYPDDDGSLLAALREMVGAHVGRRPAALFVRDLAREADPGWFQGPDQIGYVCYADLFAGTLAGAADHLDYLRELGITYLHLMPLLRPRRRERRRLRRGRA